MSILIYDDFVPDNYTSATHTVNVGTVTEVTDIDLLKNRSVLNKYVFYNSGIGADNTILITLSSGALLEGGLFIFGMSLNIFDYQIQLRNSSNTTVFTSTINEQDSQRTRFFDGVEYIDRYWDLSSVLAASQDIKTIRIFFNVAGAGSLNTHHISGVYLGKVVDVDINPKSIKYNFSTQGQKERSEGGQIISNKNNSYMKCNFTTTATTETNLVSSYFDINYQSSVSEPIIFIPQVSEEIMLYGTQEKPNSTSMPSSIGRDSASNEWLYETQFYLEEEL